MKQTIRCLLFSFLLPGIAPDKALTQMPTPATGPFTVQPPSKPAGPDPSFRFVLLSDTHVGSPTGADDLRRTVQDINKQDDLRFVLISGDITEFGADTEFHLAKQILDSLDKPWHVIPGNHDDNWSESGTNSFRKIFGGETFAFSSGGYFFLGNNCGPSMRMGPGQIPHEQILWMDSVLKHLPDPKMPVVFVNHYPQDSALNNWYQVIDMLKMHNTQLILCGHGHANHLLDFEGVPGVMGRSNLRAGAPAGGYNIVTFTRDSAFFTERRPDIQTDPANRPAGQVPRTDRANQATGQVPRSEADTTSGIRHPAPGIRAPWTAVRLYDHHFSADTFNYYRPSYAINQRYPQVKIKWTYQDKADIGCGMALADGLVITADTRGDIFALDGTTGRLRWRFATGGKIFSTPYAIQDKLVAASTDGNIYCLRVSTGRPLWKYSSSGPIVASPVVEDGLVYIGSSDGHFRALSLETGLLKWDFNQVRGFVADRPLIYGDRIFFASWGNDLYALDKRSGRLAWTWNNGASNRMYSAASCLPVAVNGRIYIVAPDRYMTALHVSDGSLVWRRRWDSSWVRESMGLSADSSLVYVKTMQGQVLGISTRADTAQVAWHSGLQLGYELDPAAMVESNGILYVPSDKGVVAGIDRVSGDVRWMFKIGHSLINTVIPFTENGQGRQPPVAGRLSVLASTMDGRIVCLLPSP